MHRIVLSLFLWLVFMVPQVAVAATLNDSGSSSTKVELTNVRWSVNKDAVEGTSSLRVVIDTTGPVKVKSLLSEKTGPQLTIDVKDAVLGKIDQAVVLDGEIASKVTVRKSLGSSQVVVDLSNMIDTTDYKVFTLPSNAASNKSFRIVIDINKPIARGNLNFTPGLKGKVIVIDPGHGGSDSGAIGPNQTQEKTITLAISQKVQALLEKAGARVLMTRQVDVDVYGPGASAKEELEARTQIGNGNKADVFVSLHINAFNNPSVGGVATYYYQKTRYDAMLAQNIQDNLASTGVFQDRGINTAGFYVIKRTTMPAVLAELGFISNPDEERLLNTSQVQQQMAQSIVRGLDGFFTQASKRGGDS